MCLSKVEFEAKSQTISLTTWATKLMANSINSDKISKTGIRKALNLSKGITTNRSLEDLECLIGRWRTESHTFIAARHEFYAILEDVVVLTSLPMFEEAKAVNCEEVDEITLGAEAKRNWKP